MSEWNVQVVRISEVRKHPNADTLSVASAAGYPVIFRTGDYAESDLAVHVPVDSVVPENDPRWDFLDGHRRIRAKRLRGIFSMGLLAPVDVGWTEGQNVGEELGIEKYEPGLYQSAGGDEDDEDPGFIPVYTDMDGLRRYSHLLTFGEEIVMTEKIHGANARFLYHEGRFWAGSHHRIKKPIPDLAWNRSAASHHLAERMAEVCPGVVLYGEIYGWVQDLKYGAAHSNDVRFRAFDALAVSTGRYLDYDEFVSLAGRLKVPTCPELYRGPWDPDALMPLMNGRTLVDGADQIREGFVVRPVIERWDERLGRVILKCPGEDYLLRKSG